MSRANHTLSAASPTQLHPPSSVDALTQQVEQLQDRIKKLEIFIETFFETSPHNTQLTLKAPEKLQFQSRQIHLN